MCDEFARNNVNIHCIHQKNKGVSAARNAGIDYLLNMYIEDKENIYIAFLDADDAWKPNFFNDDIWNLFLKKYDLLGFQSCLCDSNLIRYAKPMELICGEYSGGESSIWLHSSQHFGAMFYNLSFLKSNQVRFEKLKYSEDKIFSMSCLYLASEIF